MKNFISTGNQLTLAMPYAVSAGGGVKVGSIFGVAANSYDNGVDGVIVLEGVFDLAKDASVFAVGAAVYWDNTAKAVTSTSSGNTLVGVATVAALTGDATARVLLK